MRHLSNTWLSINLTVRLLLRSYPFSLTNFTNSGTITGSSGVFTFNTATITTLTNTNANEMLILSLQESKATEVIHQAKIQLLLSSLESLQNVKQIIAGIQSLPLKSGLLRLKPHNQGNRSKGKR